MISNVKDKQADGMIIANTFYMFHCVSITKVLSHTLHNEILHISCM